ncbi:MAG: hypothetical protein ACI81T_001420, partial [Bacteroidia bacterium]
SKCRTLKKHTLAEVSMATASAVRSQQTLPRVGPQTLGLLEI